MTTMCSAGSWSAMFAAEATITRSEHFHLQVVVCADIKEAMKIEFRKECQFSFFFFQNWIMNLKTKFPFFFENSKMISLHFHFHFFWKFEKRNQKIYFHFYQKVNFEKWVIKLFPIFNRNENELKISFLIFKILRKINWHLGTRIQWGQHGTIYIMKVSCED